MYNNVGRLRVGVGYLQTPQLDAPVHGAGEVEMRQVERAGRGVARHAGDGPGVRLHALRHARARAVQAACPHTPTTYTLLAGTSTEVRVLINLLNKL